MNGNCWKSMGRVAATLVWGAIVFFVGGANAARAEVYHDVAYTYSGGFAVVYHNGDTKARDVPSSCVSYLKKFESDGHKIRSIAFRKNGGWAIVYGKCGFQARNIPTAMLNELRRANHANERIYCVAISPGDGWVVLTDKHWRWGGKTPIHLRERMNLIASEGGALKHVSFNSSNGWRLISVDKNGNVKSWSVSPTAEQKKVMVFSVA